MSPKTKFKLLLLLSVLMISSGFRCTCFKSQEVQKLLKPIKLVYWRVWDSPSDLGDIISDYKKIHPNITIEVRKLRFEEFEKKLLESYAELRAPDIISLHYGWLKKYVNKDYLAPMPEKITMAYQFEKSSLGVKKEIVTELRTTSTLTPAKIKELFIDTVSSDVIIDNKIYGLPLNMDTLVMFYNRDMLNQARIPTPPSNWQEFQDAVKKTTFFDENKNIIQAGAALGTAENIRRSADILMLLMKQNGATIIENGRTLFSKNTASNYNPGLEALKFYTDFSNPRKEVYAWNEQMTDSLKAFSDGKLALYFGYSYDIASIRAFSKNALNFGIARIPQIQGNPEKNIANYWVEAVSKRTQYPNEAWDFILFMTKAEEAKKFLAKTKKPTALRSLVSEQLQNDDTNVFASQLLTSETWYSGLDFNSAELYVKDMIEQVNDGGEIQNIINTGNQRVQQTLHALIE